MKIHLSGRQFVFPRMCVCCGDYPLVVMSASGSERHQTKRTRTKGWSWDIPYCVRCKKHVEASERLQLFFLSLYALTLPIEAALGIADRTSWLLTLANLVLSSVILGLCYWLLWRLIRDRLPMNCCAVGRAMTYLGSEGTRHSFECKSRFYAVEFVRDNPHKVVDPSPEVAGILRNTKYGKHQMPRRIVRKS